MPVLFDICVKSKLSDVFKLQFGKLKQFFFSKICIVSPTPLIVFCVVIFSISNPSSFDSSRESSFAFVVVWFIQFISRMPQNKK